MSQQFTIVHNLVNPETGKTYKEENLEIQHKIPVGTLVEVKWDAWFGNGACWKVHARLWVVAHTRDCDGTPLYSISRWNTNIMLLDQTYHSVGEKQLIPIEVTPDIEEGRNILAWDTEDD